MAQRTGQAQFRQIVSEDAVDQVQLRAGDRLLRLHNLHRIDHPGFHARARHLQGFLGNLHILARHLDLSGGGFQIEAGLANLGFDLPACVVQLGLALRQHRFGLCNLAGGSSTLPQRNAEGADHREGSMRLGRVGADHLVVAADGERRQP